MLVEFLFVCLFFCSTPASHCCGLSRCGAQDPDAQAQRPWLAGPAALRRVGSSRTGARTRVPCIGRRTLNHCATREALSNLLLLIVGLKIFFKHCKGHSGTDICLIPLIVSLGCILRNRVMKLRAPTDGYTSSPKRFHSFIHLTSIY